jgi:putative restriction endonuclease
MKEGQKLWTREQLVLAINLYCKLPFGKMHSTNPAIIEFASLIGRTPDAVAFKLVNFASLDPTLQVRGIKGMGNTSRLDEEVWNEFYNNWDAALLESEKLLAKMQKTSVEEINGINEEVVLRQGLVKEQLVKVRVNQSIFRKIVLATYNNKCCITGISSPELLIASHIVPWSKDEHNRLNPMNGLALNALHDKAFDAGLITIDCDTYKLKVSTQLDNKNMPLSVKHNFFDYENKEIILPDKFLPDRSFLKQHNDRFKP